MLLNGGTLDGARILKPATVAAMGSNHITRQQGPLFWHDASAATDGGAFSNRFDGYGFGYAIGVRLPQGPYSVPGTPGELTWGGLANTYYLGDRQHRLVALVFAQYLGADEGEPDRVLREALYGPFALVEVKKYGFTSGAPARNMERASNRREARHEGSLRNADDRAALVDAGPARGRLRLHRVARDVATR